MTIEQADRRTGLFKLAGIVVTAFGPVASVFIVLVVLGVAGPALHYAFWAAVWLSIFVGGLMSCTQVRLGKPGLRPDPAFEAALRKRFILEEGGL